MESLRVELGVRSYPIVIGTGILGDARVYRPFVSGRRTAVVTSRTLAPLYLEAVTRALKAAGGSVIDIVVEDGEQAKRWQLVDDLCGRLLAARLGRDSIVIALGGGVIGDLAGFTAAVYQRGIPYLQIPTTLLAQVDSSVGGKTAINHAAGKNMIGAFHQPLAVVADVGVLDTLPDRELRAGLAEVVKYGLALDASFAGWLESNLAKILARDPDALIRTVRRCCELKARIVAADERESGERALLNFGHTFGHGIEAAMGYGAWLHGEAVSAGMVMAACLSRGLGLIPERDVERIRALLARGGLPVSGPRVPVDELLEHMAVDKKNAQGQLRFVVLNAIGSSQLRSGVDPALVRAAIIAATQ